MRSSATTGAIGLAVVGLAAVTALAGCGSSKSGSSGGSGSSATTMAASGSSSSSSMSGSMSSSMSGAMSSSMSGSSMASGSSATAPGAMAYNPKAKGMKVGAIMPDKTSSQRWVSYDPNAIAADCKAAGLVCNVQNANNDKTQMKTIAEKMINDGDKLIMIVNLDSPSAAAIEKEAQSKGVITIDYDRLTLGGSAAVYVSYDNTKVGTDQGHALTACSQVKGKSTVNYVDVNGSKTDNNATLFKNGYDAVLSKQPGWKKLDDQWIDKWAPQTAGTTFASMLSAHANINAVMVANDDMANAVIAQLRKNHLNGQVAVSGQDATEQGLDHIMDGDQCFTIYKPSSGEAEPAVAAATDLLAGQAPKTTGTVIDTQTGKKVPAILAEPIVITKANVAEPINAGYASKAKACAGAYAAKCTTAGVK